MKSYNNVTLIGKSVKEVEHNDISATHERATFCLAFERPYKDDEGKCPCDFINIVAWGRLAAIAKEYVTKGSIVLVSGRIQCRSYECNGEDKWIPEIVAENINVIDKGRC